MLQRHGLPNRKTISDFGMNSKDCKSSPSRCRAFDKALPGERYGVGVFEVGFVALEGVAVPLESVCTDAMGLSGAGWIGRELGAVSTTVAGWLA